MTLCDYCYKKGMTLQEYKTFKQNIINTASAIIQNIKTMYKTGNGLYHPINEILVYNTDADIRQFIIMELKNQGVEFYDNNSLWRY
jgi:hypothetical protein